MEIKSGVNWKIAEKSVFLLAMQKITLEIGCLTYEHVTCGLREM